jgi:hypothetical protein
MINSKLENMLSNLTKARLEGDGVSFEQLWQLYNQEYVKGLYDIRVFGDLQEYMKSYDPRDGTKFLEAIKK